MTTKVEKKIETDKNNVEILKDNSLFINELKPCIYDKIYGNGRLDFPVCIVQGILPKVIKKTTFRTFLTMLKTGDLTKIETAKKLKTAYQNGDKKTYDTIKQNLNGFVIGDFESRRDVECLMYVPLLCLDIDGYNDHLEASWDIELLKKNEYVFAAWYSPSGCGLRVLVWTDAQPETHKTTYTALQSEFCTFLNLTTDKTKFPHMDISTSNISRLWFFTETDDVYLNQDSTVFCTPSVQVHQTTDTKQTATDKRPQTNEPLTDTQKIEACAEMVTRRNQDNGRNNFIYNLACLSNEHGVSIDSILSYCQNYIADDFTKAEIDKTVTSAVKRTQHGKFSDSQLMQYLKNGNPSVSTTIAPKATQNSPSVSKATTKTETGDDNDTFETDKKEAMNEAEEYISENYELRYNIISNEIEISRLGKNRYVLLNANDLLRELQREKFRMSEKALKVTLGSSFVPKYNAINEFFEKLPQWQPTDKDHIGKLASYVKAKDQFWFNSQFKKAIVRTAACALGHIAFNKQCFTLVGKQNDGKTSFVRFLCPPQLKAFIKENLDIDKDGRFALCQNFIINLDELATFSKQDINQIKTYFTTETVKDRPPYGDKPMMFKRVASFFASTNNREFLTDETGNVRWLVFEIDNIQHDNGGANGYGANVDINGVWAQAYTLLKSGFDYKLTAEELAYSEMNNNTKHRKTTYEMELIQEHFEIATEQEHDVFLTAAKIKDEIEFGTNRKTNHVQIGKALKALGYGDSIRRYDKDKRNTVNGYYLKRREIQK